MTERLLKAREFAKNAHESILQKRKYSGEPYCFHPQRVTQILIDFGVNDEDTLAASDNHDVFEDVFMATLKPQYSLQGIADQLGWNVARLVNEVTNVYSSTAFPTLNRRERNVLEAARLATISEESQLIKFADIIDNVSDLKTQDLKFAQIYIAEKRIILNTIQRAREEFGFDNVASATVWSSLFNEAKRILK